MNSYGPKNWLKELVGKNSKVSVGDVVEVTKTSQEDIGPGISGKVLNIIEHPEAGTLIKIQLEDGSKKSLSSDLTEVKVLSQEKEAKTPRLRPISGEERIQRFEEAVSNVEMFINNNIGSASVRSYAYTRLDELKAAVINELKGVEGIEAFQVELSEVYGHEGEKNSSKKDTPKDIDDIIYAALTKAPLSKIKEIARDQEIYEEIPWDDESQARWEVFDLVFKGMLKNYEEGEAFNIAKSYGLDVEAMQEKFSGEEDIKEKVISSLLEAIVLLQEIEDQDARFVENDIKKVIETVEVIPTDVGKE